MAVDLNMEVPELVGSSRHVTRVELAGSRARGTAGRFSDWDFVVETDDFATVAAELPAGAAAVAAGGGRVLPLAAGRVGAAPRCRRRPPGGGPGRGPGPDGVASLP